MTHFARVFLPPRRSSFRYGCCGNQMFLLQILADVVKPHWLIFGEWGSVAATAAAKSQGRMLNLMSLKTAIK